MIQGFQTLAKARIASFQAEHAAEIGCRLKRGSGLMLPQGGTRRGTGGGRRRYRASHCH